MASSQEARLLTRLHRRELGLVSAAVIRRIEAATLAADPNDIDTWWVLTEPTVTRTVVAGHNAASTLAARYLRRHAATEGVVVYPVRAAPNLEQISTALRVTGPVAFKTNIVTSQSETAALQTMRSQLTGSAHRLTLSGDRSTVMQTFAESDSVAGWRRITGGEACEFCAMLASRGAVYSSDTVDFQAHDRCSCTPEPVYE